VRLVLLKYCEPLLYCLAALIFILPDARAQEQKDIMMSTKGKYQNRLIHEKSPYLLQHADNPVDWYPWGVEAFERARKEDKPIFLSIGYSTCHWCHVMEHESFEVPEVAQVINKYFIPIKVDREERPDIDNIYMSAVMAITGRGGWPLTVLLTPDKQPFFGGTYFPPKSKWGSPGLLDIMESVHEAWTNKREELIQSGESLTQSLKERAAQGGEKGTLTETVLATAFRQFEQMYDSHYGGFGSAPKFPTSHNLSFLLRYWKRAGDAKALAMVEHTLVQMAQGGMYDHIGGGFHRYATDQEWQIPHFEKMLYDQAILARTYLEAYQITKNDFYGRIAREIFDYVLRDMQHTEGGFYSAEDADSLDPDEYAGMTPDPTQAHAKKEGSFYLWRHDEINGVLGSDDAKIFNYHFGIKPGGNAHADPQGEFTGKNIIFVEKTLDETAGYFKRGVSDIQVSLRRSQEKLFEVRERRPRSHLDDKVLVDWNGLMISSLAFGGRVLNEPRYTQAAETAAQFVLENLVNEEGRLLHRYRDGEAAIPGTIEDYAFFVNGLLDLYEATFQIEYLKRGIDLAEGMVSLFWDEADGGFFFTANDAEKLLFRQKEIYDGAIPSGNSIAALVLVRLSRLTLQEPWEKKLEVLFEIFAGQIAGRPSGHAQMMTAFDFAIGPSREIVIAASSENANVNEMVKEIYGRFIPNKVILLRPVTGQEADSIVQISPFVENQLPIENQTTAYVCENHVCKLPVRELTRFQKLLDGLDRAQ